MKQRAMQSGMRVNALGHEAYARALRFVLHFCILFLGLSQQAFAQAASDRTAPPSMPTLEDLRSRFERLRGNEALPLDFRTRAERALRQCAEEQSRSSAACLLADASIRGLELELERATLSARSQRDRSSRAR